MGIILYLSLLASHEPVHWTIRCDGWKDLASEVRKDEYLDEQSKSDLINYFKTKVEEECVLNHKTQVSRLGTGSFISYGRRKSRLKERILKRPITLGETKWHRSHTEVSSMIPTETEHSRLIRSILLTVV